MPVPSGIAIDAHDAGDGAAVGLHVGGRIVGLAGDGVVVIVVEAPYPGVVPQDRHHPRFLLLQGQGRRFDAGLEQAVDRLLFAAGKILIVEKAPEGVVIAMVAARLGDIFQLQIGGFGQPDLGALGLHPRVQKIGADHGDIVGIERQVALDAQAPQGLVAVDGQHASGSARGPDAPWGQ